MDKKKILSEIWSNYGWLRKHSQSKQTSFWLSLLDCKKCLMLIRNLDSGNRYAVVRLFSESKHLISPPFYHPWEGWSSQWKKRGWAEFVPSRHFVMVRVSGRRLGHKDVSSSTRQRRNDTGELTKRTGTHSLRQWTCGCREGSWGTG